MIRLNFKWMPISWLILFFLIVNIILGFVTNVPTNITESDESIFRTMLDLKQQDTVLSYEQEISLIKAVQQRIISEVPVGDPIPNYADREPADLLKKKTGLCYDRSRTYDKVFSWLGFRERHIYILYLEHPVNGMPLPYWQAFFVRGTQSHAVTEVKTQRGWLVVDSNAAWVSVTRDGTPVDADSLQTSAQQFDHIPIYFNRLYLAIRGLYPRRGQLYRPYIPYPQLNWSDFWTWILDLKI